MTLDVFNLFASRILSNVTFANSLSKYSVFGMLYGPSYESDKMPVLESPIFVGLSGSRGIRAKIRRGRRFRDPLLPF